MLFQLLIIIFQLHLQLQLRCALKVAAYFAQGCRGGF